MEQQNLPDNITNSYLANFSVIQSWQTFGTGGVNFSSTFKPSYAPQADKNVKPSIGA
jgi:hypothetical protein